MTGPKFADTTRTSSTDVDPRVATLASVTADPTKRSRSPRYARQLASTPSNTAPRVCSFGCFLPVAAALSPPLWLWLWVWAFLAADPPPRSSTPPPAKNTTWTRPRLSAKNHLRRSHRALAVNCTAVATATRVTFVASPSKLHSSRSPTTTAAGSVDLKEDPAAPAAGPPPGPWPWPWVGRSTWAVASRSRTSRGPALALRDRSDRTKVVTCRFWLPSSCSTARTGSSGFVLGKKHTSNARTTLTRAQNSSCCFFLFLVVKALVVDDALKEGPSS
mmetsp:Transcript_389/g.1421  ORF Transcript_389/g.1421 Transcript_389/m.1421 type:complete len:275 (+) Transcript_389:470-1294(+)